MPTLVMKFGGTSVGTPEAMAQSVQIVQKASASWPRLVVVTSALSGITDLLLATAAQAAAGDTSVHRPRAPHRSWSATTQMLAALVPQSDLHQPVLAEIRQTGRPFQQPVPGHRRAGRGLTRAPWTRWPAWANACPCACWRRPWRLPAPPAQAVEATRLIVTDDHLPVGRTPILRPHGLATRACLNPCLDAGQVPVVTGFMGATPEGIITTLGRGGSDYTAAILGAALPADEVWIWTDVNGVMTADPRLVPDARTIDELSYREVAELAYFGAKVLHPADHPPGDRGRDRAEGAQHLQPRPSRHAPGGRSSPADDGKVIKAVTVIKGLRLVTVEGRGMLGVPGVAARTFGAIAATHTSVPLISQASSEQSICFAVPSDAATDVVAAIQAEFSHEIAAARHRPGVGQRRGGDHFGGGRGHDPHPGGRRPGFQYPGQQRVERHRHRPGFV